MKRREQENAERKRLKKLEKQIWSNAGGHGASHGSKKVGAVCGNLCPVIDNALLVVSLN